MGGKNLDQFNSRQQAKAKNANLKQAKESSPKNLGDEQRRSNESQTSLTQS